MTATNLVSDEALYKAALGVSLMVRHMPDVVFKGLARSHGVGLFAKSEGLMVYPENHRNKDTPECKGRCDGSCSPTCTVDGRKYDTIAGMSNIRSSVLADSVVCNSHDPYRHKENLVVHEFGHLVMRYVPLVWKLKIYTAYYNAKNNKLWKTGVYAMANANEYWAEATSSFFMSIIRKDVSGGMNMCGTSQLCHSEAESRTYLEHHDPKLFDALQYAYTDNRPHLPSGLKPCL